MKDSILDRAQTVGYDTEKKRLIVTVTRKMAEKMIADGWNVGFDPEVGHYIQVTIF